jgi:hypothetical protein
LARRLDLDTTETILLKNLKKADNYSLVKIILGATPNGLNSKLKICDKAVMPFSIVFFLAVQLTST